MQGIFYIQGSVQYWPERAHFYGKGPEKFNPPIQALLSVLHQNKVVHNF